MVRTKAEGSTTYKLFDIAVIKSLKSTMFKSQINRNASGFLFFPISFLVLLLKAIDMVSKKITANAINLWTGKIDVVKRSLNFPITSAGYCSENTYDDWPFVKKEIVEINPLPPNLISASKNELKGRKRPSKNMGRFRLFTLTLNTKV